MSLKMYNYVRTHTQRMSIYMVICSFVSHVYDISDIFSVVMYYTTISGLNVTTVVQFSE